MPAESEKIIQIALEEVGKLLPEAKSTGIDIEEIEVQAKSGHYLVTVGYWARDNKPKSKAVRDILTPIQMEMGGSTEDILNPWRRKYKRVEVDSLGQIVAIRMYEPPIGVS